MAIPKNAKRVFKGIIFDVYQWKQKLYDGTYAAFEKIKRQDTVVVIATTDNQKVVVQKQIQPGYNWFLTTPSGRMDKPGESPRQCALRELLEETGMKPRKIFLYKKYQASRKIDHTVYTFIAQGCRVVAKPRLDGGEKIKNIKYSFDQFVRLHDNMRFLGPETQMDMFRAVYNKRYKAKFKGLLFG